jgi:hypothetical protein
LARPDQTSAYIEGWQPSWMSSPLIAEAFQMRYKCCGWKNSSDTGLLPCPHGFESGCIGLVKDCLEHRFAELERGSITGMCMALVSSITLFVIAYRSPDGPLITRLTDE